MILSLVEKMNEEITKNKYGIAIMADLEEAFDSVWRLGGLCKLHKARISENLLLIFASFMRNHQQRNLVNTHVDEWSPSETGVLQGSILSPLIFLVYTADITVEEQNKSDDKSNEFKYADDFNLRRLHNNYYTLLVNIQLMVLQVADFPEHIQTNYMVFYGKKLPPPPDIPVTTDKKPLTKVKEKRILGAIINENLSFTSHIEQITKKCKAAYNRLTLYPDLLPYHALQLYKAYIRTNVEYGCIIWGHTIYQKNPHKTT